VNLWQSSHKIEPELKQIGSKLKISHKMRDLEALVAKAMRLGGVQPEDKLLLAVSGGVDSVVLTEIVFNLGNTFAIAHCNFGLRGVDSDLDQALVERLGDKLFSRVFVKKFDKNEFQKGSGSSLQMHARDLRYQFFKDLTIQHGYQWIVTAHHLDDQLDTTLLNLSRGTGIKGLVGMSANENGIFRPFLSVTKAEILAYARANELIWREDHSNTQSKYARNKIRNKVVPLLRKLNPSLEKTYFLTHDRLEQAEKVVDIWLKSEEEKVRMPLFKNMLACFDLEKIKSTHAPGLLLQHVLKPFPFNYSEVKQMLDLERESGARFFSGALVAFVNRGNLEIYANEQEILSALTIPQLPFEINTPQFTFSGIIQSVPPKEEWQQHIWMDFDSLKFPLVLRPWQAGDVLLPFGLKGRKKVSDLLIDAKVSLAEKPNVMVLESDGEIAWVLGHRLDQRFALNKHTEKAVCWNYSLKSQ
jgi:tRNA(Ile)-lysidine synthase